MNLIHKEAFLDVPSADANALSISSDEISDAGSFRKGRTLIVQSLGLRQCDALNGPPKELVTTILDTEGNVLYRSTRDERDSGNAVLSRGEVDLIATKYFFGPGRDPKMYLFHSSGSRDSQAEALGKEIKTISKWYSRKHLFTIPDGTQCEWRYAKERSTPDGKKEGMLVLYEKSEKKKGSKIAQLVRNNETRTPGSSKWDAGNGGELVFDAEHGGILSEPVVVATCLLMLKKEIDRSRANQAVVLV